MVDPKFIQKFYNVIKDLDDKAFPSSLHLPLYVHLAP